MLLWCSAMLLIRCMVLPVLNSLEEGFTNLVLEAWCSAKFSWSYYLQGHQSSLNKIGLRQTYLYLFKWTISNNITDQVVSSIHCRQRFWIAIMAFIYGAHWVRYVSLGESHFTTLTSACMDFKGHTFQVCISKYPFASNFFFFDQQYTIYDMKLYTQ